MKNKIIQAGMLIWVSMGLLVNAQVDYGFWGGTASLNIPHGPGLRANQNFEATITVENQSANNGIPVSSFIRYELVPNTGPPVPLRWRVAEASPLISPDRNIPGIAAAGTNFVLTTILNPPPGIAPGTYSLRGEKTGSGNESRCWQSSALRHAFPMPRHVRIEYEGAFCHVMARGNRRNRIFASPDGADEELFLATEAGHD